MKFEILLSILLAVSLLRMAVSTRVEIYIKMLALQGVLLFGFIFCAAKGSVTSGALIVAIVETLLIKAILVPFYLRKVIIANHIKREDHPYVPAIFSLIAILFCVILGTVITFFMRKELPEIHAPFFSSGVTLMLSGFFLILTRKKLISHIIGYCILENGIFLLSLGAMAKMPHIVSLGVALDAFIWVLLAGILVKLIRVEFRSQSIENLKGLKN